MKKNQLIYISISIFVLFSSYFLVTNDNISNYRVLKVVDGDTVILDDGNETFVRYIGINSPEILTDESPGEPFAVEAKMLNEKLLSGKNIKIEFDKERYDQYGRMLGYVFADGLLVNRELVRSGLAASLVIKPNTKYFDNLQRAEQEAKKNKRGIWSDSINFKYPGENSKFLIKPQQAGKYIGQRVVARGKITDLRKSEKVVVLNMDKDFDVVIFKNGLDNFSHFGINPERDFIGYPVEVIGRVKLYKGKPQIVVSHPITLKKLL